jgi:hypothetical protein
MTIPVYNTGTVSVAASGAVVSGGGTTIWGNNVREGDWIVIDGAAITMVLAVTDDDHLVIPEWQFGAKTNVEYAIYQNYSARSDSDAIARDVGTIVAAINANGFPWIVPADRSEPDPSWGDEGQVAFQPGTGKQWHKEGGAWVFDGVFKAFGAPAPYDNDKTYSLNEVATSDGSSYVWINPTPGVGHAPPNATYWEVLAAKGEQGATGPSYAGTTSTNLTIGTGNKTITTQEGRAYVAGTRLRVSLAYNSADFWMEGVVTAYSGTTLSLAVDKTHGAGTNNDWTISLAGQPAKEFGGASTTSIAIGAGAKVFTTQADLAYLSGARVRASSAANTSNWMEGVVTYGGAMLSINVDKTSGSGTFADWNFNPAGQPGAGDLSSANALSELSGNAGEARGNIGVLPSPQVRVTLVSGVAVPVSDVTGATTIYATPVGGNQVPIWDGSKFVSRSFSERALALCNNTGFAQYQAEGNVYDLYMAYSGGAVIFGSGPSWSAGTGGNTNARGGGAANTAEVQWINGIPTNKNAIQLRTGALVGDLVSIPANRATVVGSFWAPAAGQASDSKTRRLLANVFNLVERRFNEVPDPAYTSSVYSSSDWRYANNNGDTLAFLMQAFPGELVKIRLKGASATTGSGVPTVRIGVSVDGAAPTSQATATFLAGVGYYNPATAFFEDYVGQGFHYFVPFEAAAGDGANQNFVYESTARMIGRAML